MTKFKQIQNAEQKVVAALSNFVGMPMNEETLRQIKKSVIDNHPPGVTIKDVELMPDGQLSVQATFKPSQNIDFVSMSVEVNGISKFDIANYLYKS